MNSYKFKKDEGVAGLTIFLSVVVMLFVIGLLVFIFVLMSVEIADTDTMKAGESATATDTSVTVSDKNFTLTDCDSANQGAVTSITEAWNDTVSIDPANFTYLGCVVSIGTGLYQDATIPNVTYGYTYAGAGWNVANDTAGSLSTVTDWFPIFIVIGAMVVLILLTVIIITAIRGSGMMGGNA